MKEVSRALTIAGSDSGGGAGLQADIKTFTAFNVFGTVVVSSITAQNTKEVSAIHNVPVETIEAQIDAVLTDIGTDAVKTGMLSNEDIITLVTKKIKEYDLEPVVDPVMVTKRGDPLLEPTAIKTYKTELVPEALILTPNIREAELLTDLKIDTIHDAKKAAEQIHESGAKHVVIKSLKEDDKVVDLLYSNGKFTQFESEPFYSNKHGTGCTYSATITANLAKGKSVIDSITTAKDFIDDAIENGFDIGNGEHPVNHMVWFEHRN
ncbi:MAG: bifunctional hydroxymethylpyrimidine kinase/phosphomethylpyrimidine kinase [Candidatus Saliniplasma sp.]